MKLKYKFFIAFIIISFLILLLVIGVTQISVRKNFYQFVNNTEFDKQTKMFDLLKQSYQQQNGWDEFRDNHAAWDNLLFRSGPGSQRLDLNHRAQTGHPARPQKRPRPNSFQQPLPPSSPEPLDPLSLHLRLCLFDVDKQYVAGDFKPHDKFDYKPIILSNKTIGWLGLKNRPGMVNALGLEFLKNQTHSIYIVGLGIFILALFISYIMSKQLLSPIQKLILGTKAIRNLDFNTKIKVDSSDELGKLAQDFNLMAQTLKEYETLRKNWISDISHELRTPVAVIRSKIEAVQDGVHTMTPKLLDSLHGDIMGLGKLVNDLHLIALADSQNLPFQPMHVNPLELVDQCLDTFGIRFEQKQIKINKVWDKTGPFIIKGDEVMLRRVFSNLMENSLRYTNSPGIVKISCDMVQNYLILIFEDSAPGVPENSLNSIFERLYRVEESRNRSLGGSGLGLCIAREIITKHKGTIKAASSLSGGLKIKIELPLYKK